jgi:RNA polymerase sigma-70 factor (ECF subfamily)
MNDRECPDDLRRRARAGEEQARDRLLGWVREQVYPLARRLVCGDASDLAQDVCLRLHRHLDRLWPDCTVAQLLAYARATLRHAAADRGRRAGRQVLRAASDWLAQVPGDDTSPEERVERDERAIRLQQALERLPRLQRLAFRLRLDDGLTFEQSGQRLGLSLGTARRHFLRAATALSQGSEARRGRGSGRDRQQPDPC